MKSRTLVLLLFLLAALLPPSAHAADWSALYQRNQASVVTIKTNIGVGTGFFVAENMIATNFHVISGSNSIRYYPEYHDGAVQIKKVIVVDKVNDIALLQTETKGQPVTIAPSDSLPPGTELCSIGSPRGLEKTISNGVLSQHRKNGKMQISIPSSPGSSGSPVFTSDGNVVGMVVMKLKDSENLNFAIPSEQLTALLEKSKGISPANYLDNGAPDLKDAVPEEGASFGRIEFDYVGYDEKKPDCKEFSSEVFCTSSRCVIKKCICNERVQYTNGMCQCHECK